MTHLKVYMTLSIQTVHIGMNECGDDNGGCSQLCTNASGIFLCSCREGFVLHSNGFTCQGNCNRYIYTFVNSSIKNAVTIDISMLF